MATTASGSNAEWLRSIGADEVIDYRTEDFAERLSDFDVVVDTVGGKNLERSLTVLRRGGTAVSIVGPPDPTFAAAAGLNPVLRTVIGVISAAIRRRARRLGVDYSFLFMRASGPQLSEIADLVDAGIIRPVVGRVFPFAETPAAVEAARRGGTRGKVVVSIVE
ncbi:MULTISPECIES: zinc-binding dehydrogenase [unclassified Curtobacterium]|uniref:zinc-binding dehydrogenase n=1 Tax=unclassified Curtobacterium TaxID=257496 RepID=UPI003A7FC5A4